MRLLSKDLVSLDYRDMLRQDLSRATVCRFLVAYVSLGGIDSIGRHLLTRVLRDPRSFGVSSLTCSCGHEPLLRLQRELGDSTEPRLKYFMDPVVKEEKEPANIALFHSKLVYLALEGDERAVVYIGSHNWTRRALGPYRPRNAEASLRLELPLAPGDMDGTGTSLESEVNRHLMLAYSLPPCLPATSANEPAFIAWAETACNRAPRSSLDEVTVVLAVRTSDGVAVSALPWADLMRRGIYLQALDEAGRPVWDGGERILVLVWLSATDLQEGRQPVILHCQVTTNNAGPNSHLQGPNQSRDPIAGFRGVIFDRKQLAAAKESRHSPRSSLPIWSGRPVECYDFEFPTPHADSSQVDGGVTPMYQFHLKVEAIAFPADGERPATAEFVWSRESFAVAGSRKSARYKRMDGYPVGEALRQTIVRSLVETLQIDLDQAKVLPISEYDQARLGKRISLHALHETFLGERSKRRRDEYYQRARPGMLVAELDEQVSAEDMMSRGGRRPEALPRVQRVFTMPLDELAEIWAETARQLRAGTSEGDRS